MPRPPFVDQWLALFRRLKMLIPTPSRPAAANTQRSSLLVIRVNTLPTRVVMVLEAAVMAARPVAVSGTPSFPKN